MYSENEEQQIKVYQVSQGHLFFLGDHRSRSHDSREWGVVKVKDIVGPVKRVLLNCDRVNFNVQMCHPLKIRWNRFFLSTQNL